MLIRRGRPAGVFLVASLLILGSAWTETHGQAGLSKLLTLPDGGMIENRDGLLSVIVQRTYLRDLLRTIGNSFDFTVETEDAFEAVITESFSSMPVDAALHRLLRGYSFAVSYKPGSKALDHLWVIGSGSTIPRPPLSVSTSGSVSNIHDGQTPSPTGSQKEIAELAELLSRDKNPLIRKSAAAGLGTTRDPHAAEALKLSLTDSSPSVRVQALLSLANVLGPDATRDLHRVLSTDKDSDVRRAALIALSGLPTEDARSALETAAVDSDENIRQQVPSAIERLKKVLAAKEHRERSFP